MIYTKYLNKLLADSPEESHPYVKMAFGLGYDVYIRARDLKIKELEEELFIVKRERDNYRVQFQGLKNR